MTTLPLLSFLAAGVLVAGCASRPVIEAPAATLVMEDYFVGRTIARGEFVNSFTGARRGLTATIDGTWDGAVLTLVENFAYDDGERDVKTWRLTKTGERTYSGVREDVVGTARGFADGAAMRLEYDVILDTGSLGKMQVTFRDVLALRPDGSLLNKAVVSKWGFRVGRVELTMTKPDAAPLR